MAICFKTRHPDAVYLCPVTLLLPGRSHLQHSGGATHRLTQETTRPLKQGSLALSSKISSFTTLWSNKALMSPHLDP